MAGQEKDKLKIGSLEKLEFERIVSEYEPVLTNPLEITDGYDPTPRKFDLEHPTIEGDLRWVPLGHIAFQGDFDKPPKASES